MTPTMLAAVAAGGAFGSVARYISVSLIGRWAGTGFPWGTLFVNIAGSFVMGVLVELTARKLTIQEPLRVFLFVGMLGGFTTFSTFSLDLISLIQRNLGLAFLYGAASVVLGLAGLFAGLAVVRGLT